MADLADRPDGVLQRQVAHHDARLDHAQHEVGRADLEQHGRLAHVRVADDDVQAAEALGVRVRLVTGVDDRTGAGRRGRHALPDVLRALAHAVDRSTRRLQHLAGAADDLPGDEEGDQHVGEPAELAVPPYEVVLVTAVGVAGRVGVVLEQIDVARDPLLAEATLGVDQQPFKDPLTRLVVNDEFVDAVTLGRRVLRMTSDIEVQPCPVAQEHIAATAPRHHPAEQIAGHLIR